MALTVPPYGECWNPTEAGGSADGTGEDTSSVLQSVVASENVLQTVVCVTELPLPELIGNADIIRQYDDKDLILTEYLVVASYRPLGI